LARRAAGVTGSIVIGDARFPDELEFVKNDLGGHTIYLKREGRASTGAHASETSITPEMCDEVLVNDQSEQDLHESIAIQ